MVIGVVNCLGWITDGEALGGTLPICPIIRAGDRVEVAHFVDQRACSGIGTGQRCCPKSFAQVNVLTKLRLKPTKNDSVFLDFRVYKGSVNTEIKEHGDDLKIYSVCQEFSLSNSIGLVGIES